LRQISRLEDRLKSELEERVDRHDKLLESLRQKHKMMLEQKEDEISELTLKLAEEREKKERLEHIKDRLQKESDKIHDTIRYKIFRSYP
jgi:hypothetical protein